MARITYMYNGQTGLPNIALDNEVPYSKLRYLVIHSRMTIDTAIRHIKEDLVIRHYSDKDTSKKEARESKRQHLIKNFLRQ